MEHLNHKLWDEWTSFPLMPPLEDEISGILEGLPRKREGTEFTFACARISTVRRLMRLWADSELQSRQPVRLVNMRQRSRINFSVDAALAEELFDRGSRSGKRNRNWNWIRGVWGSCGALYLPRAGYHLVLRPPSHNAIAEKLQRILIAAGFTVGVRKKTAQHELMLRDQQQIVTFLSRLGFVQTALALEETAIYRLMRNHANKLVNCDAANINKSVEAARAQMALISQLEEEGILDELPEPLLELVYARKRNPSISLKELGQNLPTPISKSTVEYRWKKLETILHQLLKGDGGHVLRKGRR